ncbi:hypothetical protein RRG08_022936 [Elysia crispata]|uniref:Uncharacterized protein n=1 Tax=Elysia crispata TaxID=231223 RepID=A0AAE0XN66_9GAST|nr:hypothetical protein RRG08_022936 [Elysia crispata]
MTLLCSVVQLSCRAIRPSAALYDNTFKSQSGQGNPRGVPRQHQNKTGLETVGLKAQLQSNLFEDLEYQKVKIYEYHNVKTMCTIGMIYFPNLKNEYVEKACEDIGVSIASILARCVVFYISIYNTDCITIYLFITMLSSIELVVLVYVLV